MLRFNKTIVYLLFSLFILVEPFTQVMLKNDNFKLQESTEGEDSYIYDLYITYLNNKYTIVKKSENSEKTYVYSKKFDCLSWSVVNKEENTDFFVTRRDDNLVVSGTLKGNDISGTHHIGAGLWHQACFFMGPFQCVQSNNKKLYFYNLDIHKGLIKMVGKIKKSNDDGLVKTVLTFTDFKSLVWKANFWYDKNNRFVKSELPRGPMGPTLTTIDISK